MNIFLDTEFNDFGGELISIALVANDGRDFYVVMPCPDPHPWVKENVIPHLGALPVAPEAGYARKLLAQKLNTFLRQFNEELCIIADWPEDIKHFCDALILRRGVMAGIPTINMKVVRGLPRTAGHSATPHNALEDARALRACYHEVYSGLKP